MTPKDAMAAFALAMTRCPDRPTTRQWVAARAAYSALCKTLTADQRRELWSQASSAREARGAGGAHVKANPYLVFIRFSEIRTRLHQQTDEYRQWKATYDHDHRRLARRREQIRNAKKRYREKKRAQRVAAR